MVDRDGSGRLKLTYGQYGEVGAKGESAEWSPDGTLLVFSAGDPGGDHEVYVVGLDGNPSAWSPLTPLRQTVAHGRPMAPGSLHDQWGRHGSEAAIARRAGKIVKYCLVAALVSATWSPDGTKLIVTDDNRVRMTTQAQQFGRRVVRPTCGGWPGAPPPICRRQWPCSGT